MTEADHLTSLTHWREPTLFQSPNTRQFLCRIEPRGLLIRHDRNPRFSKSLSHLEIYYACLTPIISCLSIINTMLLTHWKQDRQYLNGDISFQIRWLSRCSIMPGHYSFCIVTS